MKRPIIGREVVEQSGQWKLVHDLVSPYSWLIERGPVPVKRFIMESEARAEYQRMVES